MKTPCANCPWRAENQGKRTPWGFYTKRNLRRLWNQIRNGGAAQSCHPTDPSHPDHIAAGAKPGSKPQECIGAVILVRKEIELLAGPENRIDGDRTLLYLKKHRSGLTRNGVLYWVIQRISLSNAPMIGGPPLPDVDMSADVRRPE